MLHILDTQLCNHFQRSGRTTYGLHVLYVDQSPIIEHVDYRKAIEMLKERYPSHVYSIISLSDIFEYKDAFDENLFDDQVSKIKDTPSDKHDRLKDLLSHLPSATSRYDVASILRQRLIMAYAKHIGCSGILYGDSTTRLAERTFSETAKGRGASVPYLTTDGLSTDGIKTSFPMRDLLKKELVSYANLITPPLTPLTLSEKNLVRHPISSKDMTIDNLMSQYFESVEQNYPSIVANVVRTSSKLTVPHSSSLLPSCILCNLPTDNRLQRSNGDQENSEIQCEDEEIKPQDGKIMCYGCARSVQKDKDKISAISSRSPRNAS